MSPNLRHFRVGDRSIAYRLRNGAEPTLLFLSGYASDMEGSKALALDAFCARRGLRFLRFDYGGTGFSSGQFERGTLSSWGEEALAAVDELTSGDLILVGSSMGAWIALSLGLRRPDRIRALVGIAAAPDFTQWGLGAPTSPDLETVAPPEPSKHGNPLSAFTKGLIDSGQRLLLLEDEIRLDCPVRLVHGDKDEQVPLEIAFRTMRALRSADVQLTIVKGGGHRLSEPHEIDAILAIVNNLLELAP